MENIEIFRVEQNNTYWNKLIIFAENCSWEVGKHLAEMMKKNVFTDWESVFVAVSEDEIAGFCTFLKTDYYPENKYFPWISTIFVSELYRGRRISEKMIQRVISYAKDNGFSQVYIPSEMTGFYEKYGFKKIDELMNYGGEVDNIFTKKI